MTLPVPTEDVEQMAVIYYCKSKGYPVHHSNNEMYTTSWKQKRRSKELGTAKGFPDLIVLAHGKVIAIEMKRTKGSTTSPEQKWWIEDERIAKEKADEKAREEQAKENERLKKEAAAKDEAQAKIRSRINRLTQLGMIFIESDQKYAVDDKIWIKQDDVENLDDESFESEYQARQKLVDERNANIKAEAKKMKEELDAANAKAAAEAAAKKVAEEEERKALLAPDKDKLVQFARAISIIQHEKLPAVKTKQAQDILNEVESKLSQLFNFIMDKSKEL